MSPNKFQPHLIVLPEDDANRQIINGLMLHQCLDQRAIQIMPPAQGWRGVLESFEKTYIAHMRRYSNSLVVLLIDFDGDRGRYEKLFQKVPEDLRNRVFIFGAWLEPEKLRSDTSMTFEEIGKQLFNNCPENTNELWNHPYLRHNASELQRIAGRVTAFLFVDC
jgi:hypothetical protein